MSDDQDSVVLRFLGDIRSDTTDLRQRMTGMERHVEEMRDKMKTSMGMAGMAAVASERHGEDMDEIRDQLEALRRPVAALEDRA